MSSPPALPDCHPFACAIQSCLSRSSSDSARCQQEIGKLYACCKSLYKALEKRGEPDVDGLRRTVKGGEACPMVSVLKRNLRTHGMSYDDDDDSATLTPSSGGGQGSKA